MDLTNTMKFTSKVRNANSLRRVIPAGSSVVLGVVDAHRFLPRLAELGFSNPLVAGESLLPSAHFGKAAAVNAEGWIEVHRGQPMETAYRQVIWEWKMKRGYYYETDSKLVDVPYKRYPRTVHEPFAMELTVVPRLDGRFVITLPPLVPSDENELMVRTAINLLIELFGECSILTGNLEQLVPVKVRRLNWLLLPPGRRPWSQLKEQVDEVLRRKPDEAQKVISARLKFINDRNPEFVAVGVHGFAGYLLFGFPSKHINVLESTYFGNATYGLGDDWENLSKLSKAELLNQRLHTFRVVHSARWEGEVSKWI